jgi:hypothetical protein
MDDTVAFASREYFVFLLLLVFARSMDFLSTWIATPNLVLEGNPIAKKLGWKWGIAVNFALCAGIAFWPISAIAIGTTSVLVAARNFQSAWLMHLLGEETYRDWHLARIQESRITVYLFCLAGNTLLTAAIGIAVIYFSGQNWIPFAIGLGVVAYALAVAFYTLLAVWRIRRSTERALKRAAYSPVRFPNEAISSKVRFTETDACDNADCLHK